MRTVFMAIPFRRFACVTHDTERNRTVYRVSVHDFVCERPEHERSALRSHRAAAAAHGVLQGHQRRRPLGRSLLGLRRAELLRGARGQLSSRRRRPARALTLEAGDFVLLPATPGFTLSGFEPVKPERIDPKVTAAPDRRSPPRHPAVDPPTCGCSAATSSSTRPMRRCWCRCCRAVVHVRGVRAALDAGAARRRGIERSGTGPRPRAHAPRGGAAHRGAAVDPG